MDYGYGPYIDFDIEFTGEMKESNGSYQNMDTKSKYLMQLICHMAYQISGTVRKEPAGIVKFDSTFAHLIGNSFSLYTDDGMTAFTVIQVGKYSYQVEFFSPRAFRGTNSFLDYVYSHVQRFGRTL